MSSLQEAPHDLASEKAVFSVLLNNPDKYVEIVDSIGLTDFYSSSHQQIWEAMMFLFQEGRDIDLVSLRTQLRKQEVDVAPILQALTDCYEEEASENNLQDFVKEIKNKSLLRQVIRLSKTIGYTSQVEGAIAEDIIKKAEANLLKIADTIGEERPIDAKGIVEEIKKEIAENIKKGKVGFDTGFFELDEQTGGLIATHSWIVGAYTGIGKTFFILQLLLNVLRQKGKVALFSTEMDRKMNMLRMIGNLAGLGTLKMLKGEVTEEGQKRMEIAQEKMASYQNSLSIFDTARTVADIRLKAKKLKLTQGLDVIAVDFIQNLKGIEDRYERMAEAAVQLQELAQELEVTMIIGSQIPNDAANNKKKDSIDYKGAGEIAAMADIGLWITRRKILGDDKNMGGRKVWIRKSRHGTPAEINMELQFPAGRFVDGKVDTELKEDDNVASQLSE